MVATVNLDCKLDLKSIALHARNAEYNPKRFAAVIMRIREPKSTALIFASGKMVGGALWVLCCWAAAALAERVPGSTMPSSPGYVGALKAGGWPAAGVHRRQERDRVPPGRPQSEPPAGGRAAGHAQRVKHVLLLLPCAGRAWAHTALLARRAEGQLGVGQAQCHRWVGLGRAEVCAPQCLGRPAAPCAPGRARCRCRAPVRVQYARILQKLGFEVTFKEFKIQNMVGSCDVKFPIRLEGLASTHSIFSSVSAGGAGRRERGASRARAGGGARAAGAA